MDPNPAFLGAFTLSGITLLGGAILLMRLREHLAESPDPKLTYATQTDLQKLRDEFAAHQRDLKIDHTDIHRLIRQNAEHIAALIAQSEIYTQRINEFSGKFDRLQSHH
ncbi:hypothetical protein [Cerasicoccus arenae]|uniref:Uncharacterized protein n=1 Tax=Cerasicoccus arenae TaxID=424488 RepID=A0A8J3GDJ8_9BACT|nr:hypothetical protein [Cerasicoccus arenae]MBK1858081.1 hypothetical protein [Cerasicoccus arenae]GHC06968.1 hypothetical protein GCM10007047_25040 [Cerasicoccus arenae]